MKSLIKIAAGAIALLMLAVPLAANAQEWAGPGARAGCRWRHRDIAWDRHNLRAQWRDIHRDRWELQRDLANGNWAAAQAERNDLRRDYLNVRRQRWDLERDYQQTTGAGPQSGYVAPMGYAGGPQIDYMAPVVRPLPVIVPPGTGYTGYGSPLYPSGPASYAAPNGQGLGALLSGLVP